MIKREEQILLDRIKDGEKSAFSQVFIYYYSDLVTFANTFLHDTDTSEEIVQEVFITLWKNRNKIEITVSLKSFLLKSIQNRCIDRLRHLKIRDKYQSTILNHPMLFENNTENYILYSELEKSLKSALKKLPDDVSNTFSLSRFEGLTYNEISKKLDISVRTVEVRVSKALVLLRDQLKEYLLTILFLLMLMSQ